MFMKSALIILGVVLMSFTSKDNENKKFGVNCTITHGRYHTVDGVRSLLWSRYFNSYAKTLKQALFIK